MIFRDYLASHATERQLRVISGLLSSYQLNGRFRVHSGRSIWPNPGI